MKYFCSIVICLLWLSQGYSVQAQDPHFSQFFASPLILNPALTGNMDADWRIITNYRQQYIGPSAPFNTFTASFDIKTNRNKITTPNYWGLGFMAMRDETLNGAFSSTYASADGSFHLALDEDEHHHLALGAAFIYGSRRLDFSQLTFEQQFTSEGFNTSLPTGEQALSSLKPYLSVAAGALYRFSTEIINLEFGASAFHLNTPQQSFLGDVNQQLPVRYVITNSFDVIIGDRAVLNTNTVFQQQAGQNYFSTGGALGYFLDAERDNRIGAGLWYRSGEAFYPYLSLELQNLKFGFSYDIVSNSLKNAAVPPKSWEVSIVFKKKADSGNLSCPPSLWR